MLFKSRKKLIALAVGAALAVGGGTAFAAKDVHGELKGQILENSGQAISGATIIVKHKEKGIERRVTSDEDGNYRLRSLPVGSYSIRVEGGGYQPFAQESLEIRLGSSIEYEVQLSSGNVEEVVVTGVGTIKGINLSSSSNSMTLTASELEVLPVGEDINSVALLAPGAAAGDSDFGNDGESYASFGGASVAENGYFLNGLNVTDIRRGMGFMNIPWEIVDQSSVVTAGVSAEFGRQIGGVTNLVAKSGTNDFHYGIKIDYSPGALFDAHQDQYGPNKIGDKFGLQYANSAEEWDRKEYSIYASGPIVQDKAFFYVLYAPSETTHDIVEDSITTMDRYIREKDQFFANLDWFITDDHALNLFYMDTSGKSRDENYAFDRFGGGVGDLTGPAAKFTTDESIIALRYTGQLTDDLSMSLVWGQAEDETDKKATSDDPTVWDNRSGGWIAMGNNSSPHNDLNGDKREIVRLDFDYEIGDHTLRFGVDNEKLTSWRNFSFHGGARWYLRVGPYSDVDDSGATFNFADGEFYGRKRTLETDATVVSQTSAIYIQDSWQVTDQLVLNLGIRNTKFSNETSAGDEYISIDNQIAPRLGAVYDLLGDGAHKLYANYGRYYMPVAQNTSMRMAAGEFQSYEYFEWDGVSLADNDVPLVGDLVGTTTYANGASDVGDSRLLTDPDIEPMYSDQIVLGYEVQLTDDWIVGARYLQNDLKSSIEDGVVAHGWLNNCERTGADCSNISTSNSWADTARIFNPGNDLSAWADFDGDGTVEKRTISAADLGYPEMERVYKAWEFTFNGNINDNFYVQGSYTYSSSKGNTEGLLKSDNDQWDPGWSRSFDYVAFTDNAHGYLPNDHKHKFKLFGAYEVTNNFTVGFQYQLTTGRPMNAFGHHPQTPEQLGENRIFQWVDGTDYGSCVTADTDCIGGFEELHFVTSVETGDVLTDENGTPILNSEGEEIKLLEATNRHRGTLGRTPTITSLDLSFAYRMDVANGELTASANIYNVFNEGNATQLEEFAERDAAGDINSQWGMPIRWQPPRSVEFSIRYDY